MTQFSKIVAGLITIGSISTAGYLSNIYLYPDKRTPIKEIITKEYQYLLLDSDTNKDDNAWDNNWKKYKNDNSTKEKDIFRFSGWAKSGSENLKDSLKQKCKDLINKSIYGKNDQTYIQVINYCARGITIKDEADKNAFRLIKTDGNEASIWQKREQKRMN